MVSQSRFTPVVIIVLLAALVSTLGLWATDRAGRAVDGAVGTIEGDATSAQRFQWKIVTTWPKNFPGLGFAAENFARYVNEMSNGRLTVQVYGAGEIVPALEVFDAVSQGVADAGHGAAYYWKGKIPASVFFYRGTFRSERPGNLRLVTVRRRPCTVGGGLRTV